WGWLGGRRMKKNLLSLLYITRALAIGLFVLAPLSPLSVYVFAATIGFLWLGTVPLTNGLIAQVFGVQYLSTLGGSAFSSTRSEASWACGSLVTSSMQPAPTISCGC